MIFRRRREGREKIVKSNARGPRDGKDSGRRVVYPLSCPARPSLPLCRDRDGEERRWIDVDQCMGELVFVSYSHIRIGIGESYSCKNDTTNITDRWTDKIISL